MDAKAEFLAVINEVRMRLALSIEAMAINAGCPLSSMSDALAGKDGRNFAGHWLVAQGPDFEAMFNRLTEERRGTSPEAKRLRAAREIGELVRRLVEEIA